MNKETLEIRAIQEEHFDESLELSQFAFQYRIPAEEREQRKARMGAEPAAYWGVYVDNRYAAQATVLELEVYIHGQRFAMGGLAAVATWPEYRRQGLVAKLLLHSLQDMRNKGQTISILHPFAFGFYRKFGWETYTEYKAYTLKTDQLPTRLPYNGRIERLKGDFEPIQAIYDSYASGYNGTLVRTDLWWKYRIADRKPGQIAVYYDVQNEPAGYVNYEVKNRKMTIHELISLTKEAKAALWSFIAQHDSMFDEVTLTAPADDRLPFTLSNPRIKQEIVPYMMARIVDAESFIKLYPFAPGEVEDRFHIELKDEHAEWNNGCFELIITPSGKATLERLNGNRNDLTMLKIDIGAFSSTLIGYLSPLQLWELERLSGEETTIKRLQARIPERMTYLPDFF